jgi:uncharacterized OsmC-like protein
MTTATMEKPATAKAPKPPRHGVDTPTLLATLGAVQQQPELARFQFRARNRWISGTHSRSVMNDHYGAMGEQTRPVDFIAEGDHTKVLCGGDNAPTPVEFLLHALAACITAGVANIAAVRGVTLHEVESVVEGDIDLRGIFGMSDAVRNGYQGIRASFSIRGDGPPEKLREIVEQARARSAVFDVLTNGVPVSIDIKAA